MNRARLEVAIGFTAMVALMGVLVKVHSQRLAATSSEIVQAAEGKVRGLSVQSVNGVDHLVEKFLAPPGTSSLTEQIEVLGVSLNEEDKWTAMPDPSLGVGSAIEIVRATPITIIDGTEAHEYRTWVGTVGELLEENGIMLTADDRIDQDLSSQLTPDLVVAITRIGVSEEAETEEIDFKEITKDDPNLEKGVTRVGQAGRTGLLVKTFKLVRENGEVVSRELVGEEVTREPTNKVTYIGTKVVTYGSGQATWYDWKPGGAAHNTLPLGTKVHVVNTSNGKSVDVVINDRGIQGGAVIDLDRSDFVKLAPIGAGRINVRLEKDYD